MASDSPGVPPRLVSGSELDTFTDCPRRWWLTYVRRLRRVRFSDPAGVTNLGTLFHGAMEAYYSSGEDEDAARGWLVATLASGLRDAEDDTQRAEKLGKAHDLVLAMTENYFAWLAETGEDQGLGYAAVEEEMTMPVTEHTSLRGKLDALVELEDGSARVLDDKTAADFSADGWAHIRRQFLRYVLLAQSDPRFTDWVSGVVVNIARRVKNPRTPQFLRISRRFNQEQLESARRHLTAEVRSMESALRRLDRGESHHDVVPPRATKDCSWICPFFAVCQSFDDGSDVEFQLSLDYEEHDPNERYGDH